MSTRSTDAEMKREERAERNTDPSSVRRKPEALGGTIVLDPGYGNFAGLFRSSTLAKKADILIEAFAAGRMDAMGRGYRRLSEIHPGLVYVAINTFGQFGAEVVKVELPGGGDTCRSLTPWGQIWKNGTLERKFGIGCRQLREVTSTCPGRRT